MQKKKKQKHTRDHIINCKHYKEKTKIKKCSEKKNYQKGKEMRKNGKGLKNVCGPNVSGQKKLVKFSWILLECVAFLFHLCLF